MMKQTILLILQLICATVIYAQTYPVQWTDFINVSVNGDNTLTKTGIASQWDAGASSQNIIAPSTDGYVQFTYAGGTNAYMVGLSKLNFTSEYGYNDYSLNVTTAGVLHAFNLNTNLGSHGNLVVGDILKIGREGEGFPENVSD